MWAIIESSWLALLLTAVVAYLLGSINWAIIITRLFSKKDIRDEGSGNAGATNVLRSEGPLPALLTTLGDLAKSMAAVLLGRYLVIHFHFAYAGEWPVTAAGLVGGYLAGLFCVMGHLFPVFYNFRGGKGVMASLGMLFVLDWRVAVLGLSMFLVTVLISRMVSLGSVLAACYVPVLTLIFRGFVDNVSTSVVVACTVLSGIIAAMVIGKHGANMRRIAAGTERRLGDEQEEKA